MSEKDEIIKLWIEKGNQDLGTAVLVSKHLPEYRDTIAFHCQQATEKYIKALMIFFELEIKKIHDLVFLLGLVNEKETISKTLFDRASALKDYSVEIRYPDKYIELSDEDICDAIAIAHEFRVFVTKRLNIDIL